MTLSNRGVHSARTDSLMNIGVPSLPVVRHACTRRRAHRYCLVRSNTYGRLSTARRARIVPSLRPSTPRRNAGQGRAAWSPNPLWRVKRESDPCSRNCDTDRIRLRVPAPPHRLCMHVRRSLGTARIATSAAGPPAGGRCAVKRMPKETPQQHASSTWVLGFSAG